MTGYTWQNSLSYRAIQELTNDGLKFGGTVNMYLFLKRSKYDSAFEY